MASENILSKASAAFSHKLLKKLCDDSDQDNAVVSPISILNGLLMLAMGAKGNTLDQIEKVADLLIIPDDHLKSLGELQRKILPKDGPYSIYRADRLYGEKTFSFLESFLLDCKNYLDADLEPVDFINQCEETRDNINRWVDEQTGGKIKELLDSGAVDSSTKLILVHAIYFKADWARQFPKEATTDEKFWISKTEWKSVKMMHQSGNFPYAVLPDSHCTVLELPYGGGDFSMTIILPDEIMDGPAALKKLNGSLLGDNFHKRINRDTMPTTPVKVSLPRFSCEYKIQLKELLKALGMEEAFDPAKSDFSGMTSSGNFAVSDIIHQAVVDVNEEGTEGGTATAGILSQNSRVRCESFVVDRPFFFIIKNHAWISCLFAGLVSSPNSA